MKKLNSKLSVEKLYSIEEDLLSLEQIRIGIRAQEHIEKLDVRSEPRFVWRTHIWQHENEKGWIGRTAQSLHSNFLTWVDVLEAKGCSADEIAARMNSYLERAAASPIRYGRSTGTGPDTQTRLVYKGFVYKVTGEYSEDQAKLLVMEIVDEEEGYWEQLARKHGLVDKDRLEGRPRMPEAVRIEVWRRDGGKCARCGSRAKLEYDHIIPLARGGSNTARNIELLCEKCNRQKGTSIG